MNTITVPLAMTGIDITNKGLPFVRLIQDCVAMTIYQLLHFTCDVLVVQQSDLLPLVEVLHGTAGDGTALNDKKLITTLGLLAFCLLSCRCQQQEAY